MTDSDAMWVQSLLDAGVVKEAVTGPRCTCAGRTIIDGIAYDVTDAGCTFHGCKSRYLSRAGERSGRRDGKRHAGHRGED